MLIYVVAGFFSALGWWGANHYVIDPYLEPKQVVKNENTKT